MLANQGWLGGFNYKLIIAVLVAWIVVYIVLAQGIKVSGKVAVVTVLAPYFMLAVLFFRTLGLQGSSIGLKFLFWPNFSELFSVKTWYYAIDQNFFQHTIGTGIVFMFSTFRKREDRIFRSSTL